MDSSLHIETYWQYSLFLLSSSSTPPKFNILAPESHDATGRLYLLSFGFQQMFGGFHCYPLCWGNGRGLKTMGETTNLNWEGLVPTSTVEKLQTMHLRQKFLAFEVVKYSPVSYDVSISSQPIPNIKNEAYVGILEIRHRLPVIAGIQKFHGKSIASSSRKKTTKTSTFIPLLF